jgi:hypothetical protein
VNYAEEVWSHFLLVDLSVRPAMANLDGAQRGYHDRGEQGRWPDRQDDARPHQEIELNLSEEFSMREIKIKTCQVAIL